MKAGMADFRPDGCLTDERIADPAWLADVLPTLRIGDVIDANDYRRPVATVFVWHPNARPTDPAARPHRVVGLSEGTEECTEHGCAWYDRGFWAVPLDDDGNDAGPKTFIAWDW